jgi:Leucine-rich repeat (LRR) protein
MKTAKTQNRTTGLSITSMFIICILICGTILNNSYSQQMDIVDGSKTSTYSASTEITSITEINLNSKNLSSVPEIVFQMKSLEALDLSNNPIETIPVDIRKLQYLRVLDLTGTNVDELPEEISELIHLQEIHLDYVRWESKLDKVRKITHAAIILE